MTIEQKLDWIFKKIKSGEYYKKEDQWVQRELYPNPAPVDFKLQAVYDTEWVQLKNQLAEDGLIADESSDFKNFVLTLKGKRFKGYVKEKRWKTVKNVANVLNIVVATIAVLVGIWVSLLKIKEDIYAKPRSQQQQAPLLPKESSEHITAIEMPPQKDSIIQKDSL